MLQEIHQLRLQFQKTKEDYALQQSQWHIERKKLLEELQQVFLFSFSTLLLGKGYCTNSKGAF
jgi:hypothetical protein